MSWISKPIYRFITHHKSSKNGTVASHRIASHYIQIVLSVLLKSAYTSSTNHRNYNKKLNDFFINHRSSLRVLSISWINEMKWNEKTVHRCRYNFVTQHGAAYFLMRKNKLVSSLKLNRKFGQVLKMEAKLDFHLQSIINKKLALWIDIIALFLHLCNNHI